MRKYKKKPITVEAIKFTRENLEKIAKFTKGEVNNFMIPKHPRGKMTVTIKTLEGEYTATEGDYIIKGVKGEFYPCKPDIFKKTYDLVEEDI